MRAANRPTCRRAVVAALALVAACGDNRTGPAKDAAPVPGGEPLPIDAAVLPACPNPVAGTNVTVRELNAGPDDLRGTLTLATSPPLDLRLFVLRLDGTIWIFKDEVLQKPTPFLDLRDDIGGPVTAGQEMGLLGLAFHPQYATNGVFFLYYTTGVPGSSLRDVLARCRVSADPDVGDPDSCVELVSVDDPGSNHNGGMLEFGRDGYLYLATGDGGGNGLGYQRAQDPNTLFGKMLRIDVDTKAPGLEYSIPSDNPFVAGGGRPEVFMLGMRNPWRWSFDRETGDMWIGDVGTSAYEELNFLRPADQNGADLGFGMYEGIVCQHPPCSPDGKVFPIDIRTHAIDGWSAIMGGQVYRGSCFPDLVGSYFYVDVALGEIERAQLQPDDTLVIEDTGAVVPRPTSIHEDARGELYVTSILGTVFRLEVTP